MAGKVWLVGAGPSDPGLMTVKGKEVLKQAEVVVYDALIGMGILTMIPKDAERIHVGKRSGNHTMRQEEISQILVEKAKEGKRVVRLKGGDPFLFGRGGEEMELLPVDVEKQTWGEGLTLPTDYYGFFTGAGEFLYFYSTSSSVMGCKEDGTIEKLFTWIKALPLSPNSFQNA